MNKKPKIIIDARMINSSGIGRYIRRIIPTVIENLPEAAFFILGNDQLQCEVVLGNPKIEFVQMNSQIYHPFEQIEFVSKTDLSKAIFWSPHYNFPIFHPGKRLVTVHDLCHLSMNEYFGGLKNLYARFMFNMVARFASSIICVSNSTKRELIKFTRCPERKITVIHNGFDRCPQLVGKESSLMRRPYFLYVGNVKPHKNLGGLIRAFSMCMESIPHDLVIVGKKDNFITGDKESETLAEAIGDRVTFSGFVGDETLWEYYRNAVALVLPSFCEGFGLPLLEAMSSQCPIICSDIDVFREVCGDSAVYFNPYSISDISMKMLIIARDEEKRQRYIKKGLRQIEKYSWEKCAMDTLDVIRKLI